MKILLQLTLLSAIACTNDVLAASITLQESATLERSVVRSVFTERLNNGVLDETLVDTAFVRARFDTFDESLYGELISVDVRVNYTVSGTFSNAIYLASSYPASIGGSTTSHQDILRIGGGGPLYESNVSVLPTITSTGCTATVENPNLGADCIFLDDFELSSEYEVSFDQSSSFLANFLVQNKTNMAIYLTSMLTPNLDPDIEEWGMASGIGSVSGDYYVTYNYVAPNAVPIPAAAWLFGSALLGLLSFSNRPSLVS